MEKTKDDYTEMQRSFYDITAHKMNIDNHNQHNSNPFYWTHLLSPFVEGDWSGKKAIDFGCGCGRNVINVLDTYDVGEMHGCDISKSNIEFCEKNLSNTEYKNYKFFVTDGQSLNPCKSEEYDAIISTIVLQHICVYEIRKNILTDMYRCLNDGGVVCFQMGYGDGHPSARDYYENYYEAEGTNSKFDVRVDNPQQVIKDLEEIGFVDIEYDIVKSHCDFHNQWIFLKAKKIK